MREMWNEHIRNCDDPEKTVCGIKYRPVDAQADDLIYACQKCLDITIGRIAENTTVRMRSDAVAETRTSC